MSAATELDALNGWFKFSSLHTVIVWLVTTGSGFTVTVTVKSSPRHPFGVVGITVYSTVAVVGLVFVIVPETLPVSESFKFTPLTVPDIWVTLQI